MNRAVFFIAMALLAFLTAPKSVRAQAERASCATAQAEVIATAGVVERLANNGDVWRATRRGEKICAGDSIRTGQNARATLYLIAKKTLIKLDAETRLRLATEETSGFAAKLMEGMGYFFSRTPVRLDVDTPHVNGGIEGTEFLVRTAAAEERTHIVMYEGKYGFSKPGQSMRHVVSAREIAVVAQNEPPKIVSFDEAGKAGLWRQVVDPADLADWVLYYEPVLGPDVAQNERLLELARLLTAGQVEAFETRVKTLTPSADTLALETIVATAKARTAEERAQSVALGARALAADGQSLSARIALSYALQGDARVDEALKVMRGSEAAKSSALGLARLSELHLIKGRIHEARQNAQAAVALDGAHAQARTLLGFSELASLRPWAAIAQFDAAIAADEQYPEARLGQGLALIKNNHALRGLEAIEIATVLDPNHSLTRSYLGRAYIEKNDFRRAGVQYELAKERDPQDPTPWLLEAERLYREGEPIAALRSLETSAALNDKRGPTRSTALLTKDRAQREALTGSIYRDLGLEERGIFEISKALFADPANSTAHRALAAFYENEPDSDRVRASELLQTTLRRPVSRDIIPAQALERDLVFMGNNLSSAFGLGEYFEIFDEDGVSFQATGSLGTFETVADEVGVAVMRGPAVFKASQFHYETDGFRPNADIEHDVWSLYAAIEPTTFFSLQGEVRHRESVQGDVTVDFDNTIFSTYARQNIEHDVVRIGSQVKLSPSHILLVNYSHEELDIFSRQLNPAVPSVKVGFREHHVGSNFQTQLTNKFEDVAFVSGAEFLSVNQKFNTETNILGLFGGVCPFFVPTCIVKQRFYLPDEKLSLYTYGNIDLFKNVSATAGINYTRLKGSFGDFTKVLPKFGLQWDLGQGTVISGTFHKNIASTELFGNTLEPTHLMDAAQITDQLNTTLATSFGGKIHHAYNSRLFLDGRGFYSKLEIPARALGTNTARFFDIYRSGFGAEFHYVISDNVVAGAGYNEERERLSNAARMPAAATGVPFVKAVSRKIPLELKYFHPIGLSVTGAVNIVNQRVNQTMPGVVRTSTFALVDAFAEWRHQSGYASIKLEARNLLDHDFNYQNQNLFTDDLNAAILLPARTFTVTGSIRY